MVKDPTMIRYLVYGKIIIDTIKGSDGTIVENVLGGGGPQGAFGARLWDESVGILTRSGTDILPGPKQMLEDIGVDLSGWVQFSDLPTAHIKRPFSEQAGKVAHQKSLMMGVHRRPSLPPNYQNHMIT
jgi:hypothetical protein